MVDQSRSVEMEPENQVASDEPIRARNVLKILTAAVEIFLARALMVHVSLRLQRLRLPKGNVYYYFSSKEEIYNAAIDRLIHSWDDAFRHISAEREPAEAIEAYVRAKLNHAWENAAETRLLPMRFCRAQNISLQMPESTCVGSPQKKRA